MPQAGRAIGVHDRMRGVPWLLPVVALLAAACGDRTPRSTEAGEPDSPVLAVGWRASAESPFPIPRALHFTNGRWRDSALPTAIVRDHLFTRDGADLEEGGTFRLWRAVFTSPSEAWILAIGPGIRGEGGALLHSVDAGAAWRDATHLLPEALRFSERVVRATPFAIWFEDSQRWWIAGGFKAGPRVTGPTVWRTLDGGATWQHTLGLAEQISVDMFFSSLTGRPALLYQRSVGGTSCSHRRYLDSDAAHPEQLVPCLSQQQDYDEVDGRGWLVVPGIFALFSWQGESPWVEQPLPIPAELAGGPRVVSFADARRGIVCGAAGDGFVVGSRRSPVCWSSSDGGESWQSGALRADGALFEIEDAVLTTRGRGWAIAGFGYGADLDPLPMFRFLRTDDGGRTWRDVATPFDDGSRMLHLATLRPRPRIVERE